jgi:hypothetical protein
MKAKGRFVRSISGIDSLEDIYHNYGIIDGLRFYFETGLNEKSFSTYVSNAYSRKVFDVIDVMNKQLPDTLRLSYDRKSMAIRKFKPRPLK